MATWTPLVFSFGAVLTSPQMNQLQANFTALAEGAGGAPAITAPVSNLATGAADQAAIAANAVGQSELKDSSGEVSTINAAATRLVLPGGAFGFYLQLKHSTGAGGRRDHTAETSTSYVTVVSLRVDASGSMFAQQRYFTASAPYDLGDGAIQQFVFAELDAAGAVLSAYAAPEAPWHYNGPTSIAGKLARAGGKIVKVRARRDMSALTDSYEDALASGDPARVREYLETFASADSVVEEVTQDTKNADMALVPHPLPDADPARIVLLDPVSGICDDLREMVEHEKVSVCDLLHRDYLRFDSTAIAGRAGPPGVPIHALKWRNSGA